MDLSDVRASLRRHWPVALVGLALIPLVMAIYFVRRDVVRPPARYTTSADVLIPARDELGGAPVDVPPVLLQGQQELAQSPSMKDLTLRSASLTPKEELSVILGSNLNERRTLMTLTASAATPEVAAEVLERYIISYQNGRRQSVLDASVELREIQLKVIDTLTERRDEIEDELRARGLPFLERVPDGDPLDVVEGASNESNLLLYERNAVLNEIQRRHVAYADEAVSATAPGTFTTVVQRRSTARVTPPPPSPLIPLLTILGVGLMLVIAIPVALDRFDPTITEARAAPGAFRAGLLATIPYMPRRLHHALAPPGSSWELAFRSLAATSISTDRLPRAIMVTSPAGTSQDAIAANFAAALAGLGATVALIGTLPRQQWFLHDVVEPEDANGDDGDDGRAAPPPLTLPPWARPAEPGDATPTFPELLEEAQGGRLVGDLRPRLARRDIENLYIVPPGEEEAELSLDGLPPLLEALARSEVDVTVIAGPALLADPNATIIAWSTRHVLWGIEIGHVNKNDAQLAADRLELAGVEPFGIALVNRHALRT